MRILETDVIVAYIKEVMNNISQCKTRKTNQEWNEKADLFYQAKQKEGKHTQYNQGYPEIMIVVECKAIDGDFWKDWENYGENWWADAENKARCLIVSSAVQKKRSSKGDNHDNEEPTDGAEVRYFGIDKGIHQKGSQNEDQW